VLSQGDPFPRKAKAPAPGMPGLSSPGSYPGATVGFEASACRTSSGKCSTT
jgi:hypothetical protein